MMDCYCDYEPATVYTAVLHTARKPHKCLECGGQIAPGEKYERVFAIWEGDPATCKTCTRCLDLREYVKAHVPCFCWAHHSMHDDAIETVEQYAHEAPGLFFGAARLYLTAIFHARPTFKKSNARRLAREAR